MAFMGTFEAQLRRNLTLHTSSFHWSSYWTDSAGNLRSTANETFGRLVGVSKYANVRANSSETREMCSRERVADGVVPETSHNRKIYVRPKPEKNEDTSTVCRVEKTTFCYTTQRSGQIMHQDYVLVRSDLVRRMRYFWDIFHKNNTTNNRRTKSATKNGLFKWFIVYVECTVHAFPCT